MHHCIVFFSVADTCITELICRAFVVRIVVTISSTADANGFAGFLLRAANSVGTFTVSSDDARTECSVKYICFCI